MYNHTLVSVHFSLTSISPVDWEVLQDKNQVFARDGFPRSRHTPNGCLINPCSLTEGVPPENEQSRGNPKPKVNSHGLRAALECWFHPTRQQGLPWPWVAAGGKPWWGPRSCLLGGKGRWVPRFCSCTSGRCKGRMAFSPSPPVSLHSGPLATPTMSQDTPPEVQSSGPSPTPSPTPEQRGIWEGHTD